MPDLVPQYLEAKFLTLLLRGVDCLVT